MDKKKILSSIDYKISPRYLDFIISRKRRPSPELAKTLERVTGIDRRAWLWPEEFHNPYLSKDAAPCAEAEKRTVGA